MKNTKTISFSPPFINDEIIEEVTATLRSGWITTGPKVAALEKEMAAYCNVPHALAVNSATSGLMLALHWYGVGHGDEVIIPAYTYCATALAVIHVGATPVMVDVDADFNISILSIKNAITEKTKAIIPVDFGGWPCDYDAIYNVVNTASIKEKFIAKGETQTILNRIIVLADAAHSLGATYNNRMIGAVADITVFSFHAVKNSTTAEGGVVCLNLPQPFNNSDLYKTLRLWSLNGQTKDAFNKTALGGWRYDVVYPGFKFNMPDVLAAIGLAQLRRYDSLILKERHRVYDLYNHLFQKESWAVIPPFNQKNKTPAWHVYPLRINGATEEQRDAIISFIESKFIAVNVHFIPLPMLTVFKNKGYEIKDFPVSYDLYKNEISLPVYPQLSNEDCNLVYNVVKEACNKVMRHEG